METKLTDEHAFFIYKGKKLTPLTEVEAYSLDERDIIKYIGPVHSRAYSDFRRQPFLLAERPTLTKNTKGTVFIDIKVFGYSNKTKISNWALVEKGDRYSVVSARAKRLVPQNLKGFRRDLQLLAERTKKRIDKAVDRLPLHKKLEVLKLSEEDQTIYDFLYKDFDIVLGLKEENATNGNLCDI